MTRRNNAVTPPELTKSPPANLERFRPQIDAALDRYSQFGEGCPPHLQEAIRYALLAGGKRLRPTLVLLAADACGGDPTDALSAACAVEMIHAYSLVHDDLPAMDDDDLRRGRPTCHKQFGEDVAILVGDALQARAFEILASEITPAERAVRCCAVLGRAAGAAALVGGQAADLAGQFAEGDLAELESMHRRKTGALFRASLALGGIVAGASDEELAALDAYGAHLGLAFQITDDLLDVAGDPETVGKRLGKDADRGKITFPKLLGTTESSRRATDSIQFALEALGPFGARAEGLRDLATFVLKRNQ